MDFEEYVNTIEETLCPLGNVQTKDINYGVQIILTDTAKKVTLNIYNGKKGIRLVWGGGDSELQTRAMDLVHQIHSGNTGLANRAAAVSRNENGTNSTKSPSADSISDVSKPWHINETEQIHMSSGQTRILLSDESGFSGIWMGSDESGKGDFFGPLVVASVCLDIAGGNTLVAAGVRDCKSMTDTRILTLRELIEETALAYTVLVMKPHVYNIRYGQVQQQGGNLNTLLALGHIAALKQTWQKYPQCRQALVDQFAKNDSIPEGVRAFAPEMKVWQRPRAEEDIAVAAASVLARAAFLQTIQDMGKEAGIGKIPKGGGEAATNAARRLVQKKGTEVLENFVKLHFANTQKI
ncbi:ribonuclease HIII [Succiniclasticum ruminis]|uniref:Ribonuclease n=1 Tax=Succiniclasticum ruminis DSM 9236 TaxID=1123323 RepID=A0A1I2AM75_9FIRM|nr:ribonuclease HIII [Succiniclasticum ruminis]SFE44986.1 ribonuclease HIII [Succiniclasticum ruminis DSM 9236]